MPGQRSAYHARIGDAELARRLKSAGAVLIEGPRACGKTETARQLAASEVLLDVDANARRAVEVAPALVLAGDTPRLIDEWQVAPALWNHVRRAVDDRRAGNGERAVHPDRFDGAGGRRHPPHGLRGAAGMGAAPALAVTAAPRAEAALRRSFPGRGRFGTTPQRLLADLELLGLLFESLVHRELAVYARAGDAAVYHYRDNTGLEVDAVVEDRRGDWCAFEVKLGGGQIDAAARTLLKFRARMDAEHSGPPRTLGVIVSAGYGYRRPDGVAVIPIAALGPC